MSDYPTEEDLKRIETWDHAEPDKLMEFVFSIWHWEDGARIEGGMWRLATGGWSGNEDIVEALSRNWMFWTLCWQRSERGGLHWFKDWRKR